MSKKHINNNEYLKVLDNYNANDEVERKLKLKKAKIPLRICLKLALKNIWKKKFRYLIMLIVCTISLSFLAFTIELNGQPLRQNVFTMVENGYQYTEIKKHIPVKHSKSDFYAQYNFGDLPADSYGSIKKKVPELTLHKYQNVNVNYVGDFIENKNSFYTGTLSTIIEFDNTNNYNLLAGRTPKEGTQEIIITDYLISSLQYFKLVPKYNNYEDYLGIYLDLYYINDCKVVGIIDTNYEKWVKFSRLDTIDETIKDNYSFINDFKMMNSVVLNKEYFKYIVQETSEIDRYNITNHSFDLNIPANSGTEYVTNYKDLSNMRVINTTSAKKENFNLFVYTRYNVYSKYPTSDDEIVLPMHLLKKIYGAERNSQYANFYVNFLDNQEFELTITSNDPNREPFKKKFKVVGLTQTDYFYVSDKTLLEIYETLYGSTESIMVELPENPEKALSLFNKAFDFGYVINVWVYRSDIESYEVDPFINILSKGGLFVFTVFTIGIMWTIISIEIVDSKKEIGILRSIGLSGVKVSLIFIIQTLSVNLIAYGISVKLASEFIPLYNSGITDELGKIILYMYTLTYRTPVYLLIFVLVITILSTVLPLIKIMSQKIIDVINEREK